MARNFSTPIMKAEPENKMTRVTVYGLNATKKYGFDSEIYITLRQQVIDEFLGKKTT